MISPSARTPRLRSRRGFALLVTIVLVAFLVLILVGLATFTRVETQVAANSQQLAAARQNALMALNIAVGQLQQAAGPDQRVTARAEILDSNPATVAIDGVRQPLWTGVWLANNPGAGANNQLDVGSAPTLRAWSTSNPSAADSRVSWLVSGAATASASAASGVNNSAINPATWTANATNSVTLASNLGGGNITVAAPLVDITAPTSIIPGLSGNGTTTIGKYGYWVADEGVKAKVNITDPTLKRFGNGTIQVDSTADLPKNLLHFVAPQSVAAHKILPSTLATDFRANPNVDQILTPQQLPYLPAAAPTGFVLNRYAPDVTTYGFGVLADVRRGGLKKDLTAAFEDSGNTAGRNYAKLNPDGTARVYTAPEDTVPTSPTLPSATYTLANGNRGLDGLRWLNFHQHYNLYKSAQPAVNMNSRATNPNGATPPGVGDPASGNRPYSIRQRGIGWIDNQLPNPNPAGDRRAQISYGALSPVFLSLRWDVTFNSQETAPLSGQYRLFLSYHPQLVLHNPYSVRLHNPLNNFRYGRALATVGNIYLQIRVPDPAPAATSQIHYVALNLAGTLQRLLYNTNFADTQSLEPGEMRVFGLGANETDALKITGTTDPNGAASEFKYTAAPFGLVSTGYGPNLSKTAEIQRISALHASDPLQDTYAAIPPIPAATNITLRLTRRPTSETENIITTENTLINFGSSGSGDVSISAASFWPTVGGGGGSIIPGIGGMGGSNGGRLFVSGAPGVANTGAAVPTTTRPALTAAVETLTGKTQVLSVFIRKKGVNQTGGTTFTNANIAVPQFAGNSLVFNPVYDAYGARWWDELYSSDLYSWPSYPPASSAQLETSLTTSAQTSTSWGNASTGADTPPSGGSRIVLYDVPVQPLVSLGQFMHMQPFYMFDSAAYSTLGFGSMFIGGSLPCPEVPLNQTVNDIGATLVMDHSFLANQTLFDGYFLSTVPPAGTAPSGTVWPAQWTEFNTANSGANLADASKPLPNRRITPIATNGNQPAMADLRDMDTAAANLLLNGAFNINSTSVDAWRAYLSSLSGNDLDIWDASDRSARTLTAATLDNPFVRFAASNSNNSVNSLWSGIRSLTDPQITDLAEKIVTEVKTRGPFLSMADFLNRRLGPASDLTRAGALQAAIDKTTLNDSAKSAGVDVNMPAFGANSPTIRPIAANMRDASSSAGSTWKTTIGAPGYLMQQDLVQALSPVMSARSDTFVIRTYGESINPVTGDTQGKAWGEAVVQRLPEYLDASLSAWSIPAANSDNERFGRRFKIVSFRWLSSNDL